MIYRAHVANKLCAQLIKQWLMIYYFSLLSSSVGFLLLSPVELPLLTTAYLLVILNNDRQMHVFVGTFVHVSISGYV